MWRHLLCVHSAVPRQTAQRLRLESTFRTLWLPYKPVLWLISTNSFQFSPIPGQEEASCYSMTNQGWPDASNRGIWSPLWVTVINISRCSVESEREPCDLTGNRGRIFTEPFLCARQCPRASYTAPAPSRHTRGDKAQRREVSCLV